MADRPTDQLKSAYTNMPRSKSGYKQTSRDSWVDVWEEMPPAPPTQTNQSTNQNAGNTIGRQPLAERESHDIKEPHSDSAWEDVDTE